MAVRVAVRLFAALAEAAGTDRLTVTLPEGATVGAALEAVGTRVPAVARYGASLLTAVNLDYVPRDHRLRDGDELALIPPVSGGAPAGFFAVTDRPIDVGQVIAAVADPGCGAIVTFLGTVRDHAEGRPVAGIDYHAYRDMAERKLAEIGEEIRRQWGELRVAIVHRTGHLAVGEVSVAIAVAAPHRAEAFAACRHAIERIKVIVPIWKKEAWVSGGGRWVGHPEEPRS
ncbi:MAG TPA: molybdenum cofactor biosynthesis protein MoaE [Thermodesulfobacteriota bacterium]|nr:molybdenum cofactor biosynthesis protein MoaE [Thermodesulfobacteriota bacterium]